MKFGLRTKVSDSLSNIRPPLTRTNANVNDERTNFFESFNRRKNSLIRNSIKKQKRDSDSENNRVISLNIEASATSFQDTHLENKLTKNHSIPRNNMSPIPSSNPSQPGQPSPSQQSTRSP